MITRELHTTLTNKQDQILAKIEILDQTNSIFNKMKGTLGDYANTLIKTVIAQLSQKNIPTMDIVFEHYHDEMHFELYEYIHWDAEKEKFTVSFDSPDDFQNILGAELITRVKFAERLPEILDKMIEKYSEWEKDLPSLVTSGDGEEKPEDHL